jgi:hypothetical protein
VFAAEWPDVACPKWWNRKVTPGLLESFHEINFNGHSLAEVIMRDRRLRRMTLWPNVNIAAATNDIYHEARRRVSDEARRAGIGVV